MIRRETFTQPLETFASERKQVIKDYEEKLAPHVRDALKRLGLAQWQAPVVRATLEVFDESARYEMDEWNPIVDDMRDAFEYELDQALSKTKQFQDEKFEVEVEKLSRWLATAAVNAGVEAATTSDTDDTVGLEWVTMEDDRVRALHAETAGQTVPSGQPFSVGDVELLYPGQPVGSPEHWINCRCVVRPALVTDSGAMVAAAAEGEVVERPEEHTSVVLVALPAATDPISAASSEDQAHMTLLFFGETVDVDAKALEVAIAEFVDSGEVGVITDKVSGYAMLGDDKADVVLFDAKNLAALRSGLMQQDTIEMAHSAVEQFPTWIPHVTLGYPETPATSAYTGESVTFDRIALWYGSNRTEWKLGKVDEVMPKEQPDAVVAAVLEQPADAVEIAPAEEDIDDAPMVPDEEAAVEIPFHGVLAPEGKPSGDRRQFGVGSQSWRDLPIPMKSMFVDDDGHKGSVVSGRIDKIWREDQEDGSALLKYEGMFDFSEAAYETIRMVANGVWSGVSVDLDSGVGMEIDMADGLTGVELSAGRICAATVCAIPAFAEAFIALGLWADSEKSVGEPTETAALTDAETFEIVPPKTKDGPGWITHPEPTKDITSYWVKGPGAAKIGWGAPGDFNRCRVQLAKYVQNPEWLAGLCANLHYRALGIWPGRESASGRTDTMALQPNESAEGAAFSLSAAAAIKEEALSVDLFKNPMLDKVTPLQINTETGHVYGHIATWGTCHVGYENECMETPHSDTDYGYFHTGELLTDAGLIAVGQLTLGGGHADGNLKMRAAMAHYDNVTAAVADVCAYEDDFGVAVSGALRPDLTPKTLREMRAASYSGDWRSVVVNGKAHLEMIAALAVNVPGFPIPRAAVTASAGHYTSLTAAGVVTEGIELLDESAEEARTARVAAIQSYSRKLRASAIQNKLNIMKGV